jgi:hypothetical protein
VFGASVLLAEGASQKPQNGIRTRGSQGPDDSQGHGVDMAHQRGGFKVIRPFPAGRLRIACAAIGTASDPRLFGIQMGQNSCKKISQNLVNA